MDGHSPSTPGGHVRIIRATIDDAARVGALFDAYRQFYGEAPDLAGAVAFITDRLRLDQSAIYLALAHDAPTRTDAPAGFTQLYPSFGSVAMRRIWVLNDLFVAHEYRRRGVGPLLILAAERHGRETGAGALSLLTRHDNGPAQRLYERMGWAKDTRNQRWVRVLD